MTLQQALARSMIRRVFLTSRRLTTYRCLSNSVREKVNAWRQLPNPADWKVTPETARLLQHWRSHKFQSLRPFFCQVEAAETAIWLAEVAPKGRSFLAHIASVNEEANPELMRIALKLATGAGKTTVMAMLIAWQTVNAVRHPQSNRFTRGFFASYARDYNSRSPPCTSTQ